MATRTRKSTTPHADAEAAKFDALDKKCRFLPIKRTDVSRLKCAVCETRPQAELSVYAVSKRDIDLLVKCECPGKLTWLQLLD